MSKGILNSLVLKNLFEDVDGKELLPSLIESGVISKEQIEEYYKTNIKSQKPQKLTYSTIKDGVLVRFDERDLGKEGKYVTPTGVHTIGALAFHQCENLYKIKLRSDVIEIKEGAFSSCRKLQSVQMVDGVRRMGEFAFKNCCSLSELKLSNNLRTIPLGAFVNCASLIEVELPKKLEVIYRQAFSYCTNLNTISNPGENLTFVSSNAFAGTPIGDDFMRKFKEIQKAQKQEKENTK